MIGYVTLGTNDLARGARFYDAIAAEMGLGRMMEFEHFIAWGVLGGHLGGDLGGDVDVAPEGNPGGRPTLGLTRPFDGQPASVGNGVMVALEAAGPEQVRRIHAAALAHGGFARGRPARAGPGSTPAISATPMATSSTPFAFPGVRAERVGRVPLAIVVDAEGLKCPPTTAPATIDDNVCPLWHNRATAAF